jgi:EmrB/QacA subfamily drug resistance transporter
MALGVSSHRSKTADSAKANDANADSLANSKRKWWVLASVACGTFMATLDSSIVNIALPTLTKDLAADLYQIKWVVIIYLLVITCLLLPFGRLSDQIGRKKMFQLGYLIFVIGSGLCGFSSSLLMLVLCRALQGVGASMLMVNGPAIITATFPVTERGAALGTLAMVVSAGLISGPSIGGYLITELGWRSIFWVNIPIGLAGIFLVYRFVRKDLMRCERAPFDWGGAILQMILMISLIVLFDPPRIAISGSEPLEIPRWIIAVVTLLFGMIFIKVESVVKAPVFDLSLLKNRTFWSANLASFLMFVSFSAVSVLMPFFLEEALGLLPHQAGLFMTAIPLMIFVVAPLSGRLSDKFGSQELSFAGAMVGAVALLAMAGLFGPGIHAHTDPRLVILALCSIGLATGLFQSPNNNAIMSAVPPAKLGVASAFLATVRNLGFVVGTGMATGMFTWRLRATNDYIASLHLTYLIAAIVGFGAMLACLGKERGRIRGYESLKSGEER